MGSIVDIVLKIEFDKFVVLLHGLVSHVPQALKEELDNIHGNVDVVHETGEELIGLIGDPDKPEVEKNVEDVDQSWDVLNQQWMERQKALDEALRKATNFQDELMVGNIDYLDTKSCLKFCPFPNFLCSGVIMLLAGKEKGCSRLILFEIMLWHHNLLLFDILTCFQKLLVWLESMEKKLAAMGSIGADIDTVKQQITDLKVRALCEFLRSSFTS